jgi:hypothetical protein
MSLSQPQTNALRLAVVAASWVFGCRDSLGVTILSRSFVLKLAVQVVSSLCSPSATTDRVHLDEQQQAGDESDEKPNPISQDTTFSFSKSGISTCCSVKLYQGQNKSAWE